MPAASGRGKNYSNPNEFHLLDLVEELKPCGSDEWTVLAARNNCNFGKGASRTGEDLRNKFKVPKITY
jgi:hypothetical protein